MPAHPYVITEMKCDDCGDTMELKSTLRKGDGATSIFECPSCGHKDHLDYATEQDYYDGNPIPDTNTIALSSPHSE